jgi:hypothetical protein
MSDLLRKHSRSFKNQTNGIERGFTLVTVNFWIFFFFLIVIFHSPMLMASLNVWRFFFLVCQPCF